MTLPSETPTLIRVPQNTETKVNEKLLRHYAFRYAYARSADCQTNNDPGQDYLTILHCEDQIAVSLCDGVSESFYGDLAARELGEMLVHWSWDVLPGLPQDDIRPNLDQHLTELQKRLFPIVKEYPLPPDLSKMITEVMEKKRVRGSESTFITCLIDYKSGRVVIIWMGDSRVRIWGSKDEVDIGWPETFMIRERWSSQSGCSGEPHIFHSDISQIRRISMYSDGLKTLNQNPPPELNNSEITELIHQTKLDPTSDDVSIFDIAINFDGNNLIFNDPKATLIQVISPLQEQAQSPAKPEIVAVVKPANTLSQGKPAEKPLPVLPISNQASASLRPVPVNRPVPVTTQAGTSLPLAPSVPRQNKVTSETTSSDHRKNKYKLSKTMILAGAGLITGIFIILIMGVVFAFSTPGVAIILSGRTQTPTTTQPLPPSSNETASVVGTTTPNLVMTDSTGSMMISPGSTMTATPSPSMTTTPSPSMTATTTSTRTNTPNTFYITATATPQASATNPPIPSPTRINTPSATASPMPSLTQTTVLSTATQTLAPTQTNTTVPGATNTLIVAH